MGLIAIEGMEFHAYHGYYAEERVLGGLYSVDVYVQTDFKKAAKGDDLSQTINYETIYKMVRARMKQSSKLLETIGEQLVEEITTRFNAVETIKVRINKFNPPMGGKVHKTYVEVAYDYRKKCSKCGQNFTCYANSSCWCKQYSLDENQLKELDKKYKDCLCQDCLKDS